ncbi:MAG: NAD(P)H-binding protein [Gammaproteobacteria bacterium]|nr:NAD(P)H-binding protein [Gammaproteobacteria bacterium]NNC98155.1 NAD(P)H-binding protein [Gammaproteobacteria bacterium]NNM13686.1 NAD(P)H-binding protein [Gammaproteobacteria bacterium]
MKTALVIGATGLTGKHIVSNLLDSNAYAKVVIFTRRELPLDNPKLVCKIVDFYKIDEWAGEIQGDDLFSALGTTIKQAGSKDNFYKVDYTFQANFLKHAAANGVGRVFLISAPGVSVRSPVFYNRVKAKLDTYARTLAFQTLVFFRPSIIYGNREDSRPGERFGEKLLSFTANWVPSMKRLKPISGDELGSAIVNCAQSDLAPGEHNIEWSAIFNLL